MTVVYSGVFNPFSLWEATRLYLPRCSGLGDRSGILSDLGWCFTGAVAVMKLLYPRAKL